MSELKIDVMVPDLKQDCVSAVERAEGLDIDCIWTTESDNDAFLPQPLIAEHTSSTDFGTRIATSFTRSPMVLAYKSWDLQQYSNGRFILGLGTQVKGHNVRRFSVNFEWSSPGPRLREVVESIRHIWDIFQGREEELDYSGDFYQFSLMPDHFNPGPIENPDIPIYIAGVNEYNIQLAGEICDGLCMHGFNTPKYTEQVIAPMVEKGAERGDRDLNEIALSASPFIITGDSEEEIESERERVRRRIAFYASTRTYHDVLDVHGWTAVGQELHEISQSEDPREYADKITDEMVSTFAIEAPPEQLLTETKRMYGDVADRVILPLEYGQQFTE